MYRTDKQFMRNPATASSRIYVGNLPDNIINQDLEEKFKIHGKILGLVLQKGFGFIQFEAETQAQAAIANEHGTIMNNRKINVRQALEGKNKFNNSFQQNQHNYQNQQHSNQQHQNQQQQSNLQTFNLQQSLHQSFNSNQQQLQLPQQMQHQQQQQQPQQQQQYPQQQQFSQQYHQQQQQQQHQQPQQQHLHQQQQHHQQQQQQLNLQQQSYQQQQQLQPPPQSLTPSSNVSSNATNKQVDIEVRSLNFSQQEPDGPSPEKRSRRGCRGGRNKNRRPNDNFRDLPFYEDAPYQSDFVQPTTLDRPERNDCEIIVVLKSLTEYAEYIEQRLKNLGLIVDLLFPNDDVPIGKVLANISSRGCLYAILVMPQNEEHRSLTLNVLHGVPQEHRNMPLDDALILITKNFDGYMRGDRLGAPVSVNGERHPENMQMLLNLLAENRQLTTLQYDRLIKYLKDRKEVQKQQENLEGEEKRSKIEETDVIDTKQAELQSRIMNILNKTSAEDAKLPTSMSTKPTPLLNDPSVQKALDSLLSGDMLKNIAGGK